LGKNDRIERLLIGFRRHLHGDNLHALDTGPIIKSRRMFATEFAKNLGLAHAGGRIQQKARHTVSLGIMEQFVEPL
jgi:hypothetical protein